MYKLFLIITLIMSTGDERTIEVRIDGYDFYTETGCQLAGIADVHAMHMQGVFDGTRPDQVQVDVRCDKISD